MCIRVRENLSVKITEFQVFVIVIQVRNISESFILVVSLHLVMCSFVAAVVIYSFRPCIFFEKAMCFYFERTVWHDSFAMHFIFSEMCANVTIGMTQRTYE